MKKLVAITLLIALCVASFAGCNNQGTPTDQTTKPGTTQPTDSGTTQPGDTTEPTKEAVRPSIARQTHDTTPKLDPAVGMDTTSTHALTNCYDTLVFPDGDNVKPWAAESWEMNADGTEYTFKLREDIVFHDGTPLRASDVVFSMKRLMTIGEGFAFLFSSNVKDVVAKDDFTVTFTLNGPFGPFVSTLCRFYIANEKLIMANLGEGIYGEFGDYGRDFLLTMDAGSGPYKHKEIVQGDYWLGEKNNDWWGEFAPYAPEQIMNIAGTEPTTVRTMMSTQTLEFTDMWQAEENIQVISQLEGVKMAMYSTRLMELVWINGAVAPTDDLNIRKAVSCLINYEEIIDKILPGSNICNGPVSRNTAGHVDALRYPFDLEKAKEYIAMSKYADNIGDYNMEFFVNTDSAYFEKIALQLQANAKKVGMNIEITKGAWPMLQDRISHPETTPHFTIVITTSAYNEAGATLESNMHSKTAGTYENVSWLSNPELDKKIEDALYTPDQTERFKKYADIQNEVMEDYVPAMFIADMNEKVCYQASYIDWYVADSTELKSYLVGYPFFFAHINVYTDR